MNKYRYAEAGHDFTPASYDRNRCQYAGAGYCDGTRPSPEHELIDASPDPSWTERDGYIVAPLVNRGTLDAD